VDSPSVSAPKQSAQDLIGGFAAADPALNAVGSMAIMYTDGDYRSFDLVCSGSLIDSDTVLTAKHCIEAVSYYSDYGYSLVFSIGPVTSSPAAWSEVIALQPAPGDYGGFNNMGHDVAVLQLATPLSDTPTLQLGTLTPSDIGKDFVGMGYGDMDNNEVYGTRRVGTLTLRANSGYTWEVLYGSFAAFYEWETGESLPPECADVPSSPGGIILDPVIGAAGGGAPGPIGGSGGSDDDAGVVDCSLASYIRSLFESVRLEDQHEVVAGGAPGNAQPCYGDSGSPLLKLNTAGQLVGYGVVSGGSGSRTQICDHGVVYAAFDSAIVDFLNQAKGWADPCKGLVFKGECSGSVARRCSTLAEGERRKLAFDCANVGSSCEPQPDGSVGCGDDSSFEPPAPARAGEVAATPRELLAPIFRKPVR
jgi:hypothetical protein